MNDDNRINTLQIDMATLIQRFSDHIKTETEDFIEINNKLDKIIESINGNGKDGLKVRVDRVERTHGRIVWTERAFIVGAIGLVGKIIYDIIQHFMA